MDNFADANIRAEVVEGQFAELFRRVEKEIQHWVKAAVESRLGQLGTVGALAVEEFLSKLKEAIQDLRHAPVASRSDDVPPLPRSVAGSLFGGEDRRAPSESGVPSEFGERSVVPSGGTSCAVASTSKPGKNSQKIMWGVLVVG